MSDEREVEVRGAPTRCPYCSGRCSADDDNVVCNACLARHHRLCWEEDGGRCGSCRSTVAAGEAGGASEAPRPPRVATGKDGPSGSLPPEVRARLERELAPGEALAWVGRPVPGNQSWATLPIVLFAIPWTAFSVFWVVMASGIAIGVTSEAGPVGLFSACFPLFGLPFVAIGVGMLSAPYWAKKRMGRTCYAVTDRRVLLLEAGFFGGALTTRSYEPGRLGAIARTERSDGTGDLILEQQAYKDSDGDERTRSIGLIGIARVREVEELIRRTLLTRGDPSGPASAASPS